MRNLHKKKWHEILYGESTLFAIMRNPKGDEESIVSLIQYPEQVWIITERYIVTDE